MNCELEAMALEMPEVQAHPNRLPFRGVLTLVGVPSRRSPSGARSHRVMLTRKATEAALPSLLGMALDYAPALNAHDQRRKIGVITEAEIVPLLVSHPVTKDWRQGWGTQEQELKLKTSQAGSARLKSCPDTKRSLGQGPPQAADSAPDTKQSNERGSSFAVHAQANATSSTYQPIAKEAEPYRFPSRDTGASSYAGGQVAVSGFLYAHDFADVVEELRAGVGTLGMSYEITDAMVVSPESPIWTVTSFTFTGAAVLRKTAAAYPETWIEIS